MGVSESITVYTVGEGHEEFEESEEFAVFFLATPRQVDAHGPVVLEVLDVSVDNYCVSGVGSQPV